MIDFWIEKNKCTGCAACYNICNNNAIEMKTDEDGFLYPLIKDNCIDCRKCYQICYDRILSSDSNFISRLYAVWSIDKNTRFLSTSGGAFSELARTVLRQGGIVVGAGYEEDNRVVHRTVKDEDGLNQIRQSKYVQSEIRMIFRQIKMLLQEKKWVLFCGTPCQVAGLNAYLENTYSYLVTIDFICRGVNSPKAFNAWLSEIEQEEKSKVKKVWFKYKNNGWKSSPRCTRIEFESGKYKIYNRDENLFMKGYLGPNLYIRPSCGICDFKGISRQSDITLADFWGIDKKLDDDRGTSMVLINSKKGEELFEKTKSYLQYFERKMEEIEKGNICFKNSVKISDKSGEFLKDLDVLKFSEAFEKNI